MEREKGQEQEIVTEKVGKQEQTLMPGTPPVEDTSSGLPEPSDKPEDKIATRADTDALLDAVKELTKQVGELKEEWSKWRKAGKF